mmetsp:Transcript_29219/g.68494  ORF Transcript_29219/g.68494 Transcript_29219/m.68494 type:complete len:203 (-) Transcript_29219:951-1559(-)
MAAVGRFGKDFPLLCRTAWTSSRSWSTTGIARSQQTLTVHRWCTGDGDDLVPCGRRSTRALRPRSGAARGRADGGDRRAGKREHGAPRGGAPLAVPRAAPDGLRREAARVPRQRGHLAEAAGSDRRGHQLLRARQRQRAPRRARALDPRDQRLRGGARQGGCVRERRVAPRDRLHARGHRGDQLSRCDVGCSERGRRRRDCH